MANDVVLTRYDISDLNDGKVAEFPVADPPGWDAISLYYAKALKEMGWKDPPGDGTDVEQMWEYSESPTSYYFQAAMHWTSKWPDSIPPAPVDERWNHCTHGPATAEKYFLPWHRAYIYWLEVIIRSYVSKLGGPEAWALPYWNYSYYDADAAELFPRSNLPWVFCQPKLPDGSANPLFIAATAQRGLQPTLPGTKETMYLEKLTPFYYQAYAFSDYYRFNKQLDNAPHGAVHGDVGSGDGHVSDTGWMQYTVIAAFDPIFFLHHSEIDRFWVGWLAEGHENPKDEAWLSASDDPQTRTRWNFWRDGDIDNKFTVRPGQMLDPAKLSDPFPYSYQYQNLPQTPAPRPQGPAIVRDAAPAALRAGGGSADPVLAAADEQVVLGHEPVSAALALSPAAPAVMRQIREAGGPEAAEPAPHVELELDGVVADGPPGNYELYLNYPDADRETAGSVPHYVGLLAGFGADHHHGHGGSGEHAHGLDFSFDITELVAHLHAAGDWNESEATVTFVPAARPRGRELKTKGLQIGSMRIRST